MVISVAAGAPDPAFALPVAPMAPEPLVPELSAPVKVRIVIDAATLWDKLALTVTRERVDGANARHISAVPNCTFVRCTRAQLRPAPVTALTRMPEEFASVAMNASTNWFGERVEKSGLVMLEPEPSAETFASMPIALQRRVEASSSTTN